MMLLRPAAGFAPEDAGAPLAAPVASLIPSADCAPSVPGLAAAPTASGMFSPLMCLLSDADIIAGEALKQEAGMIFRRNLREAAPGRAAQVFPQWPPMLSLKYSRISRFGMRNSFAPQSEVLERVRYPV